MSGAVAAAQAPVVPLSPIIAEPTIENRYRTPIFFEHSYVTNISLYNELKSRFPNAAERATLQTNEVAIKALKEIKWDADVKSFFTKPIVLIAIGCLALCVAILLPQLLPLVAGIPVLFEVAVAVITTVGITIGTFFPLYLIHVILNSFVEQHFPHLSEGYGKLSQECQRYIDKLESDPQFHISLGGPALHAIPAIPPAAAPAH